ncbi:MAG: hypothetical protein IGS03_00960 [Candidatus Sericytochromatia bacterium]|nr:hypothetical protein [Candidatus Sericytochromatia bacterium]
MTELQQLPDAPALAPPPEHLGHWQIGRCLSPPNSWPAVYAAEGPEAPRVLLLWWPAPLTDPTLLGPRHALKPWLPPVLHSETLPTGQARLLAVPAEAVLLSALQPLSPAHWLAVGDWLSDTLQQLQQRAWVYASDSLAHLLVCPLERRVCLLQWQAVLPRGPALAGALQALQSAPEHRLPAPLPGPERVATHAWVLGRVLQAAAGRATASPADSFWQSEAPAGLPAWAAVPDLLATLPAARPADAVLTDWWQAQRSQLLPGAGWLQAAPAAQSRALHMPLWHPLQGAGYLLVLARGEERLSSQALRVLGAQLQWLLQSAPLLHSLADWQPLLYRLLQYLQCELLKICQRNDYDLALSLSLALIWPGRLLGACLGDLQLLTVPCHQRLPQRAPAGPLLSEAPLPAEQPGAVCWPLETGDLVALQLNASAELPGLFSPLPAADALRWVQLSGR